MARKAIECTAIRAVADADFDRLVDGDERQAGTDPGKAFTDKDRRDDFDEVKNGSQNPLQEDFKVTVVFEQLIITDQNGNDDNTWGEYELDLGIRRPDQPYQSVLKHRHDYVGPFEANRTGGTGLINGRHLDKCLTLRSAMVKTLKMSPWRTSFTT